MLLFWRIRYLDTRDRQFKDRDLWLETDTLDPVMKAAVEAAHDLKDTGHGREMLRYRHLFQERKCTGDELRALWDRHGGMSAMSLPEYFEDESGQELTHKRMGVVLTGNPEAEFFPHGFRQHDVEYMRAEKRPIPVDQITLSPDQLKVLGYFARDLRELLASAFYKEGPGTLSSCSGGRWVVKTAVSDEEIRSFVTIFRRLYMTDERANFVKAVAVFHQALQGHPLTNWVKAIADQCQRDLDEAPEWMPMLGPGKLPFTQKRLIEVFVYTQYAHQPNETRTRQFHDCLAAVSGSRSLLAWLFLREVWKCALHMRNAGTVIAGFYDSYCQCHRVSAQVLDSVRNDHPGLGALEKKEAREARILREKAEELAKAMWESAGQPPGGPARFVDRALEQITAAMRGTAGRAQPRLRAMLPQ